MKKNFVKAIFVVAIVMVAGINMFSSQKVETLSEVALANVEALADETQKTICTGFYWVCLSDLESFEADKAKNCDVDEVEYEVLFGC